MKVKKIQGLLAAFGLLVILSISFTACSTQEIPSDEKQSIVIAIPEDPPSFNAIVGDTGYDALVSNLVMLGLTGIDPNGKIYPELAAELPSMDNGLVTVDDEAGTMDVTWKLRQDVKWADGTPVTAEDVVFTWNAIMDPVMGVWVRGSDSVESVEKLDEYTVIFHYSDIYTGYLTQLGGEQLVIWPAHYCDASQGFTNWDCGRQPLSNGPFILKDWQTGVAMTFERNPNYYEPGKPGIDSIIVKIIPDETVRKEMLLNGDSDIFMWVSETIARQLEGNEQVKVSQSPDNRWVLRLYMNQAARGTTDPVASPHPIFSDVRVRQAVRMSVDVDTIASTVFYGYSKPVWNEFFREPYQCDIPRPKYDPEAAKALLEEAGWKDTDGDGVRECHGCKNAAEGTLMEFELATYPDYGESMLLAHQLVGEQLASVGMKANLSIIEGNVMWAEASDGGTEQSGNYDMDMWDDGYSGIDPTDFLYEIYYSQSAIPGNGWNFVRWLNPEMDGLIDETYTLDEDYRKELFCKMAALLDQEVPNAPLMTIINADAYSARIEGVQSNASDVVTWNIADWTIK